MVASGNDSKGRGGLLTIIAALIGAVGVIVAAIVQTSGSSSAPSAKNQSVSPARECTRSVSYDIADSSLNPPAYATLNGGQLTVCSAPTGLWVTGTVVDPKWDGWCAQVEAVFNHISYYSAEACGPGHDETFTLPPDNESPAKASPVDVYLQTVCGKTCKSEGRGRKLVYRH